MKDTITKLYLYKTTNPEIKAELDHLVGIAERTVIRFELFDKFEKGEIGEAEYLEALKQIKIRKQLDEFPM